MKYFNSSHSPGRSASNKIKVILIEIEETMNVFSDKFTISNFFFSHSTTKLRV